MLTPRQKRISELARQEQSRRELPRVLSDLSRILSIELSGPDVLSIAESDQITEHVRSSTGANADRAHRFFKLTERSEFEIRYESLLSGFGEENAALSLHCTGLDNWLQIQPRLLHNQFFATWKLLDGITVASADLARGFIADYYPDGMDPGFEIVSWGLN